MPSTTETSSSEWILHKSSSVAFSPWDEGALLQQDSPKFWEPVDNPAKLCAQKQADRPELVSWGNGHFVSWGPGPGISSGSQSGSNAARKQAGWPTQAYERPRTRGADAGQRLLDGNSSSSHTASPAKQCAWESASSPNGGEKQRNPTHLASRSEHAGTQKHAALRALQEDQRPSSSPQLSRFAAPGSVTECPQLEPNTSEQCPAPSATCMADAGLSFTTLPPPPEPTACSLQVMNSTSSLQLQAGRRRGMHASVQRGCRGWPPGNYIMLPHDSPARQLLGEQQNCSEGAVELKHVLRVTGSPARKPGPASAPEACTHLTMSERHSPSAHAEAELLVLSTYDGAMPTAQAANQHSSPSNSTSNPIWKTHSAGIQGFEQSGPGAVCGPVCVAGVKTLVDEITSNRAHSPAPHVTLSPAPALPLNTSGPSHYVVSETGFGGWDVPNPCNTQPVMQGGSVLPSMQCSSPSSSETSPAGGGLASRGLGGWPSTFAAQQQQQPWQTHHAVPCSPTPIPSLFTPLSLPSRSPSVSVLTARGSASTHLASAGQASALSLTIQSSQSLLVPAHAGEDASLHSMGTRPSKVEHSLEALPAMHGRHGELGRSYDSSATTRSGGSWHSVALPCPGKPSRTASDPRNVQDVAGVHELMQTLADMSTSDTWPSSWLVSPRMSGRAMGLLGGAGGAAGSLRGSAQGSLTTPLSPSHGPGTSSVSTTGLSSTVKLLPIQANAVQQSPFGQHEHADNACTGSASSRRHSSSSPGPWVTAAGAGRSSSIHWGDLSTGSHASAMQQPGCMRVRAISRCSSGGMGAMVQGGSILSQACAAKSSMLAKTGIVSGGGMLHVQPCRAATETESSGAVIPTATVRRQQARTSSTS